MTRKGDIRRERSRERGGGQQAAVRAVCSAQPALRCCCSEQSRAGWIFSTRAAAHALQRMQRGRRDRFHGGAAGASCAVPHARERRFQPPLRQFPTAPPPVSNRPSGVTSSCSAATGRMRRRTQPAVVSRRASASPPASGWFRTAHSTIVQLRPVPQHGFVQARRSPGATTQWCCRGSLPRRRPRSATAASPAALCRTAGDGPTPDARRRRRRPWRAQLQNDQRTALSLGDCIAS